MAEQATTAVEDELRDYELVLVFSPELVEEAINAGVNKVSQFITERGGSVPTVDLWGKKRLAYPIKRFTEGAYVLARFKLKPAASKELEASLRITEEVIRHLLVRVGE